MAGGRWWGGPGPDGGAGRLGEWPWLSHVHAPSMRLQLKHAMREGGRDSVLLKLPLLAEDAAAAVSAEDAFGMSWGGGGSCELLDPLALGPLSGTRMLESPSSEADCVSP